MAGLWPTTIRPRRSPEGLIPPPTTQGCFIDCLVEFPQSLIVSHRASWLAETRPDNLVAVEAEGCDPPLKAKTPKAWMRSSLFVSLCAGDFSQRRKDQPQSAEETQDLRRRFKPGTEPEGNRKLPSLPHKAIRHQRRTVEVRSMRLNSPRI